MIKGKAKHKSAIVLSLPAFICSIVCTIPIAVYCVVNRNKLPEVCASHFDIHMVPDGYMNRDTFTYFSILFPIGITALFDLIAFVFLCVPLSAYNGVNVEYYKQFNRFNVLKATMMNMMFVYGSIVSIFMFSVFQPNWEYNIKCEINPEQPVPCDYHLYFVPQLVVFFIALIVVSAIFMLLVYRPKKGESLVTPEDDHWKGCFYINDERVLVPKRLGIGYTFNFANPLAISIFVIIIISPIVIVGLIFLYQ